MRTGGYEIDFWNKNGAALEAALSQAQAAAADLDTARVLLTTNIARAYFNLQRLFAQREALATVMTELAQFVPDAGGAH